jgi:hypothetical protein
MFAVKLGNKRIEGLPCSVNELRGSYGIEDQNGDFRGIAYYNVDENTSKKLIDELIPLQYKEQFKVSFMVINSKYIPPHRDEGLTMVVNYYIETSDATTSFWENRGEESPYKLSEAKIYDKTNLTFKESFKAQQNDVWALKVCDIHSVDSLGEKRLAYCLQSESVTFEKLVTA